jgi:hypothetical protein
LAGAALARPARRSTGSNDTEAVVRLITALLVLDPLTLLTAARG